jgi:hypothetical protein
MNPDAVETMLRETGHPHQRLRPQLREHRRMHTVRCSNGLPELPETCVALVDTRSRRHRPIHLPSPRPAQRSDEAPQRTWSDDSDVIIGGDADAEAIGDGAARSVPSDDVGAHGGDVLLVERRRHARREDHRRRCRGIWARLQPLGGPQRGSAWPSGQGCTRVAPRGRVMSVRRSDSPRRSHHQPLPQVRRYAFRHMGCVRRLWVGAPEAARLVNVICATGQISSAG